MLLSSRLGYGWWRCLGLAFHPVNFYVHSAISTFTKDGPKGGRFTQKEFSTRVAMYAREVQGLLEAPLQMVFTLTLMNRR